MSNNLKFHGLSKKVLLEVAKEFGVDVKPEMNKDAIISEIEAEGVTFGAVEAFGLTGNLPAPTDVQEEQEVVKFEPVQTVLVKMTRDNPRFQFGQYIFEQKKPFVVMDVKDANRLFDCHEGFNLANPADAKDYYS